MIRGRHRVALAAAGLTLAGCAGPTLQDIPLPTTFTAAPMGGAPVDPDVLAEWWIAFDDPILARFVRSGLSRSLQLQSALVDIRAARASLTQASFALLPSFDAPVLGSRQWLRNPLDAAPLGEELGKELGFGGRNLKIDTWSAGLQAAWEPDIFGARQTRREAAESQVSSAEAQAMAMRIAVASNIAQGYIQTRALLARAALLEDSIRLALESERVAAGVFRIGEVTSLDIAAARADRIALEARRGELEAGLAQSTFALDTLLDWPPGTARQAMGTSSRIPVVNAQIPPGQPMDLLRRRPDIIAATAGLERAELSAMASRRDLFPRITLNGILSRVGFSLDNFSTVTNLASAAAQVSFPWLMPANHAAVEVADVEVDRGFVSLRRAVATGLEEVEVAAAQIKARRHQQVKAEKATAWQRERLARARRTYEMELANLTAVLQAQQGVQQSRQTVVEARMALAMAQVALFTALGGGWNVSAKPGSRGEAAVRAAHEADRIPDRIRQAEELWRLDQRRTDRQL